MASALSVGEDGTTHLLWTNTNGTASLWNYSPATGGYTYENYGQYGGWSAVGVSDGRDGKVRLLWDNTSGLASPWSLDNTAGFFTQFTFGPFGGWTGERHEQRTLRRKS